MKMDWLPSIVRSRPGAGGAQFLLIMLVPLATFLALVVVLGNPPPWTIDVGGANDTRFVSGVLPPQTDHDTGITFRWFRPEAKIRLHGTEFAPVELSLRVHNGQSRQDGERHLQLKYGDRILSSLSLAPGWRTYQFLLPATPSDARLEAAPLVLESDQIRVGTRDNVERGVAIDWVRIYPLPSSAGLWRAWALTWGLAVLIAWLWRIDTLLSKRGELRWLRVGVPAGALAVGLVWWAGINPYSLAWALPELPWTLGISTGLLIAVWIGALLTPRQPSLWIITTAVGALVAGQALLNSQTAVVLGWALALFGLALLLACDGWMQAPPAIRFQATEQPTAITRPWLGGLDEAIVLVLIFLVALGLRFYQIADLPYGLWRDEARHGLEALHILNDPSYRPAYIPGGVDLPGFGMYPFALAIKLWGVHVWSMREVTGLAGALTVFPLYALVRRLYGRGLVVLLTVALLAISSWHLTISRFSFPTIFDPLLQLTGLWLLMVGLGSSRRKGIRMVILLLAAICFGLALQTYHTGRLALVVAAVLGLLLLVRSPRRWRWWLVGSGVVASGIVMTASPLIGYALSHPALFNQRVGVVSLLGREDSQYSNRAPLAVLDDAIGRHALMFNVRGDANGRHTAPGRPMLDFITGLGFLVGLAVFARGWRDWRNQFVLAAFFIGLLPSILSVDSPHGMRSIDALPFVCIIAAFGLIQLGQLSFAAADNGTHRWMFKRAAQQPHDRALPRLSARLRLGIGGLIVALALACNYWTYFIDMPPNPAVWTSFYPVHTKVGLFVEDLADQQGVQALRQVFVPAKVAANPVFVYLAYGLPVQSFDGTRLSGPAAAGALFIVSGYSYPKDTDSIIAALNLEPTPLLFGAKLPDGITPSFVVYRKK